MRKYILYLCITVQALFASCIREDISGNTPESNFESLWKIIDEQYCFLEYKHEEYGLDWNEVHTRYAQRITSDMTWENLYEVLSDMVNELRDGHVNLSSSIGTSQCPVKQKREESILSAPTSTNCRYSGIRTYKRAVSAEANDEGKTPSNT